MGIHSQSWTRIDSVNGTHRPLSVMEFGCYLLTGIKILTAIGKMIIYKIHFITDFKRKLGKNWPFAHFGAPNSSAPSRDGIFKFYNSPKNPGWDFEHGFR